MRNNSTAPIGAAISLKQAKENIDIQTQRKELLEKTNPMNLTDEKVIEFVENNLFWYPIYTNYGKVFQNDKKLGNVEILSDLGKTKAKENMPKFKDWLTGNIKEEINSLNRRISLDQDYVNVRELKKPLE